MNNALFVVPASECPNLLRFLYILMPINVPPFLPQRQGCFQMCDLCNLCLYYAPTPTTLKDMVPLLCLIVLYDVMF
jgi:hypothetical protein